MSKAKPDIKRKQRVLNHAKKIRNIGKTYRFFGISRQPFYTWKRAYDKFGEQGRAPKKHSVSPENSHLIHFISVATIILGN